MAEKLQNQVLNALRKSKKVVTFFLMNGYQMKGTVKAFDEFCVIVRTNDNDQLVYKHAISTISPEMILDLRPDTKESKEG